MYANAYYLIRDSYQHVSPYSKYVKYDEKRLLSPMEQIEDTLTEHYAGVEVILLTAVCGLQQYVSHLMLIKEPAEEAKIKARKEQEAEERERASQNR